MKMENSTDHIMNRHVLSKQQGDKKICYCLSKGVFETLLNKYTENE